MNNFKPTYFQYSERSILIEWPKEISEIILNDVLQFKKYLENSDIKQILYVIHTYNSILINYVHTIDNINDEILRLKAQYLDKKVQAEENFRLWKIPVCYDEIFGSDLHEVSEKTGRSIEQIISLHSSRIYTIFFIGFLPGFLYLGGLDSRLQIPRKKTPSLKVKKGAVGIANNQTGIYPFSTPGGWQIIGNSPIDFFDPNKIMPCFAKAGDRLTFIQISKYEHQEIRSKVRKGIYNLDYEIIYG